MHLWNEGGTRFVSASIIQEHLSEFPRPDAGYGMAIQWVGHLGVSVAASVMEIS